MNSEIETLPRNIEHLQKVKTCFVVNEQGYEKYQIVIPVNEFGVPPSVITVHGFIYERYTPNTYKPRMVDCYEVSDNEIVMIHKDHGDILITENRIINNPFSKTIKAI